MRNCTVGLVQILAVATWCVVAMSVVAADPASPGADAHLLLKQLINKGIVAGNPERSRYYSSYRGYRCRSTFEIHNDAMEIDWTQVTSVADYFDFAHVYGPVTRTDINVVKNTEKDAGFWLPNADTAKQLAEAMRVLMNSCAPKAKSD
jgi:hypothetical protein